MSYADTDEGSIEVRNRPQRDSDRRGGIERALDDLDKGLALIGEQVDRIDGVLGPILGPPRPTPADALLGGDSDEGSALRDRLDSAARHARSMAAHLRERLDRVDL